MTDYFDQDATLMGRTMSRGSLLMTMVTVTMVLVVLLYWPTLAALAAAKDGFIDNTYMPSNVSVASDRCVKPMLGGPRAYIVKRTDGYGGDKAILDGLQVRTKSGFLGAPEAPVLYPYALGAANQVFRGGLGGQAEWSSDIDVSSSPAAKKSLIDDNALMQAAR